MSTPPSDTHPQRLADPEKRHCAAAELIDWLIKQLTVTFHELIRLGG